MSNTPTRAGAKSLRGSFDRSTVGVSPSSDFPPDIQNEAHIRDEVVDLRDAGLTQTEIAARVGVSQSTVSRLLAAIAEEERRDSGRGPIEQALGGLVDGFDVTDRDLQTRIELLRAISGRLDWIAGAKSGAAAVAMAALAREFDRQLSELLARRPAAPDALDQLRERRMRRLAARGLGETEEASARGDVVGRPRG